MAKKQTQRSRAARRQATPEPDEIDLGITKEDTKNESGSGKTIVQEKIAELSVRGVLGKDSDKPKGGITKKKTLTAKQRKRKELAIQKAESLKGVLEVKVGDSKARLKKINERRKRDD